ncbi:MAG: glycosyltransferase family 4 protein, partial [Leptospiraceae bacterium]|nr:glycosyltransferase family 4 protein [Leptospiraceae bacterium]
RGGGGVTHLVELLKAAKPQEHGFKKIIVWGGTKTLNQIEKKDWLEKIFDPLLDKSLFHRAFWQKFKLSKLAKENNCSILFIPGGTYSGNFYPFVTMSQNLLPFEWKEIKRYKISIFTLKLLILRITQSKAFKKSNGIVFLTNYARKVVLDLYNLPIDKTSIIPHGINSRFFRKPRIQKDFNSFNINSPAKILYVSFIGEYKHQWKVVEAISLLKSKGLFVELNLVGSPDEKRAFKKLNNSIHKFDPDKKFIKYYPKVSHNDIDKMYEKADIFLFASSCETFGQILTEAMASGLPIACSDLSAMPEILGDAGLYFNPESSEEIANVLEKILYDRNLRKDLSENAYIKAKNYSWEKCSFETLKFISNFIGDKQI